MSDTSSGSSGPPERWGGQGNYPQPPPPYRPPTAPPGYGQPPPGYGQPPPGYGQPPGFGGEEPPPGGPPRRGSRGVALAVIGSLLIGTLLLFGGFGLGWRLAGGTVNLNPSTAHISIGSSPAIGGQGPIGLAPQQGSSGSLNTQSIANKVEPALVEINTTLGSSGTGQSNGSAAGTGMILTSNGEILTNNHVVADSTDIEVTVAGHSGQYKATVLGVDPTVDVALIKINLTGLSTVTLADSSNLSVGQGVVAIGNALGQGTLNATQGSITALNQDISVRDDNGNTESLTGLIESDASISPGDSGGALVNGSSQVVGMITAGSTTGYRRSSSTTDGFAIPASTALNVVNQIRSGKSSSEVIIGSSTGYLGVSVQASGQGLAVTSVASGSPAEQAGISTGAVITAVDGKSVSTTGEFQSAIWAHKPNSKMQVSWTDSSGQSHNASVTLGSRATVP